jgi:hypothetical protein
MHIYRLIVLILIVALGVAPAGAQPAVPDRLHPRQVFMLRNVDAFGASRLIFVDLLTGEERALDVFGERYMVASDGVYFYAPADNRLKVASVDGTVRDHAFMQPDANAQRIDWVIAPDAQTVAWTLTTRALDGLSTRTFVAGFDGTESREVFTDGPQAGIRALPVAFNPERTALFMDYQPDSIGDFTTFRQFAGLFRVDFASGEATLLPNEPGCFCGAGFGGGWFLRLALTADALSFDLQAQSLRGGGSLTIPSLRLADFTQGGDIVIAPDGMRALYALTQISNFGTENQAVQTVFILVDLDSLEQRVLGQSIDFLLRPFVWTEDNSAVILTSPERDGTWKIDLGDGAVEQIAEATYLGAIQPTDT